MLDGIASTARDFAGFGVGAGGAVQGGRRSPPMRRSLVLLAAACAVPALSLVAERDAKACGGCFGPPTETDDVVTDHRMVLSVSPQQTTLYDEIKYSGTP